ncbi:ABC transporter related [Fibrisoma limi BUZ 3]|uniref:ABC transporter related n=2 Tax=Fibrisoma limi TaxID=663275 RepID=I2GEQ9_9BACT|nr:ABC transporter related [Fibrisoma limi BUZ 3]
MGLVGASGSGKSTLLSLLAGLTDADAGEVRLSDKRVPGPAEVLVPGHPAIRLVHQEYQLMPNVSVRQNIAYAVRYYESTYREFRVNELLKLCHLTDVQDRLPRQISGGEKQRTAIARAVADKPSVLLLDEPFSHLDLPNRQIVRDMVFTLVRQEQTACLFVTHDATDALSIANSLGILRHGRLIQLDTPLTVYRRPATAYAARMTGSVNVLRAKHLPALGLPSTKPADSLCVIRPETIRLAETGIAATIRAVFFKGYHYEIEAEVSRYVCLRALTTHDGLHPGQVIHLELDPAAIWWVND